MSECEYQFLNLFSLFSYLKKLKLSCIRLYEFSNTGFEEIYGFANQSQRPDHQFGSYQFHARKRLEGGILN